MWSVPVQRNKTYWCIPFFTQVKTSKLQVINKSSEWPQKSKLWLGKLEMLNHHWSQNSIWLIYAWDIMTAAVMLIWFWLLSVCNSVFYHTCAILPHLTRWSRVRMNTLWRNPLVLSCITNGSFSCSINTSYQISSLHLKHD